MLFRSQADSEARRRVLATDFAEARGQGLVAWTAVPRQSGVAVNESRKLA